MECEFPHTLCEQEGPWETLCFSANFFVIFSFTQNDTSQPEAVPQSESWEERACELEQLQWYLVAIVMLLWTTDLLLNFVDLTNIPIKVHLFFVIFLSSLILFSFSFLFFKVMASTQNQFYSLTNCRCTGQHA